MILGIECIRWAKPGNAAWGLRWLLLPLVAALAIFAHGCHRGDVDHELCLPESIQSVVK